MTSSITPLLRQSSSPTVEVSQGHNSVSRFNLRGEILSCAELTNEIKKRVEGVYSVDSVTVNDVYMSLGGTIDPMTNRARSVLAREIKIIRTWCFYDLVPLGVFLPTLVNTNSIYRKTLETSLLGDYLLNAKPTESDIDPIFRNTEAEVATNPKHRVAIREFIMKKYHDDSEFTVTPEELESHSREFNSQYALFLQKFRSLYEGFRAQKRTQLENAKPTESDIDLIFRNTEVEVTTNPIHIAAIRGFIMKKYHDDSEFTVTPEELESHSREFNSQLALFLQRFRSLYEKYLAQGRIQLEIAYAKSKSITIKIPVELYDPVERRQLAAYIEAPEDSGFATKLAISIAVSLRSGKRTTISSSSADQPTDSKFE